MPPETSDAQSDLSVLSRSRGAGVPHPPRKWKTRVLLPAAMLLAVASLAAWSARDALLPAADVRVVPVMLRAAGAETIANGSSGGVVAQAPGWVEADPYPVYVCALTDGVLEEVLVLEGQPVEANQVVARLVSDDARLAHEQAEAQLAQKQAELKRARATAEAGQRDWDNPVERDRAVAAAEADLAETRGLLNRLPSQIEAEQALAKELEDELKRMTNSAAREVATPLELARARFRHAGQVARLEATRRQQPVLAARLRSLAAELTAARRNRELRIPEKKALAEALAAVEVAAAAVRRAEAGWEEAKLRLDRTSVRSPSAGLVMQRLKSPGDKVMLGADDPRSAHVVSLYDPNRLQVRVDVPLADAARVGVGQRARVVVDVLPDRTFGGRVTRIVREADIQKNTQQVKVAIDEPSRHLAPEMLARVKFIAARTGGSAQPSSAGGEALLFVPADLLLMQEGRNAERGSVWLADARSRRAVRAAVRLGPTRVGGWVQVIDGLRPGDRLVAEDPAAVREGQRIRVIGEKRVEAQ